MMATLGRMTELTLIQLPGHADQLMTVSTRLPIHKNLLELLIFELQRLFKDQPFLESMYKAWFLLAYYGLFRVGKLALGDHTVKAKDVHIGINKDKILFILYTSKTNSFGTKPQKIKITALEHESKYIAPVKASTKRANHIFCLFKSSSEYLALRGSYKKHSDPFFIHRVNSPVTPNQIRSTMRKMLVSINLDPTSFNTHSFRIGQTSNLIKYGVPLEHI